MKRLIFSVIVLVLIDQLSKYLLESSRNYGAAFGILQGYKILFIIIGMMAIFLFIYYRKRFSGLGFYGMIFLLGGTIGNLIDRIVLGYVRDFIALGFWPSFNLADSYNTTGVVLLIIYVWKTEQKKA
ncbi:MAG: signal peptidase II [Nanoarchaeota archaeon]